MPKMKPKSCPICGHAPRVYRGFTGYSVMCGWGKCWYWVELKTFYDTREEAIAAWNARKENHAKDN